MNEKPVNLKKKLIMLKEEKVFIRHKLNLNYTFPKERDRLFTLMIRCQTMIDEVKKELDDAKNRNTNTTNNKEK